MGMLNDCQPTSIINRLNLEEKIYEESRMIN